MKISVHCFLLIFGIFAAQPVSAIVLPTVFQCLGAHIRAEKIRAAKGDKEAELYLKVHGDAVDSGLHPDPRVNARLYKALSDSNVNPLVLRDMGRELSHEELDAVSQLLERLPVTDRIRILSQFDRWRVWLADIQIGPTAKVTPLGEDWILIDGRRVNKTFYKNTLTYKAQLEAMGIETEFIPLETWSNDPVGRGVLKLKALREPPTYAVLRPRASALKAEEFRKFLEVVEAEQGAIVIDPDLLLDPTTEAYFRKISDSNLRYVIAVRPDIQGSYFKHEWTHKVDEIDKGGKLEGAIAKPTNPRKTALGRALYETGRTFEDQAQFELSALLEERGLYIKTNTIPGSDGLDIAFYRGKNQVALATGRIFMDPLRPGHYVLFIKGIGNLLIPYRKTIGVSAVGAVAIGGLGYAVYQFVTKDEASKSKGALQTAPVRAIEPPSSR